MIRKILLASLFCGLVLNTVAQQASRKEFNVKLKSNAVSELAFFRQAAVNPELLSTEQADEEYFRNAIRIQSLRKQSESGNAVSRCFTIQYEGASDPIQTLLNSGDFEFVERVSAYQLDAIEGPCDTSGLQIEEQWYHEYVRTFEAWDTTCGDSSILIGIVDTGVDYFHPDLAGQFRITDAEDLNGNGTFEAWPDTVLVGGLSGDLNGIDEDGNGFDDDVLGYDFTDQPRSPFGGDYLFEDANPMDENNHGTIVAGVIAARPDNSLGETGIAPGCRILAIRAFSASGTGEDDDIARAIVYAADNGVRVLNFSFGDIYPSRMMEEAVKYAYAKGVIMVGSAGNGTGDEVHYPSDFDEVIAVSASTVNGAGDEFLWPVSSFGLNVDLAAPGDAIYTTVIYDSNDPESGFDFFSGTSTAAPMVAAAAGLLLSQRDSCSPAQIRGILTSSADDISSPGWDHLTGSGRLNIAKALQTVGASHVEIRSPENDGGSASDTVYIIGTVIHPELVKYHLEFQPGDGNSSDWEIIDTGMTGQVINDTLGMWVLDTLPEGDYAIRLRADRSNGSTAEDREKFTRDTSAATIEVKVNAPVWDNDIRKHLITFRNSDKGKTSLQYFRIGGSDTTVINFDRFTRNGDFLLALQDSGTYLFRLLHQNLAGMKTSTQVDTFQFAPATIGTREWQELPYAIPFGSYVNETFDFDGDGMLEVVMSEFDSLLGFGPLSIHEYNGGFFSKAFESSLKPILIPKDVEDSDGDGLLELLCSVNDSVYILEQASATSFPTEISWTNHGQNYFPSRFADTDGDNDQELIMKDFKDYYVFERSGSNYNLAATLPDTTGNYIGSVAPLSPVDDFDGDGNPEVVYGDFDGDFTVYEHASGNTYNNVFIDTTTLTKSGSYLADGDFDGDGNPELFVAVHSSLLRNDDFEYDPSIWLLRIFEANGNDNWQQVWSDYLYDIDTEDFNTVSAGNLDQDAADELVFSTFPRTYIIDYDGADYSFRWFHYGGLAREHVIGDFNGNGVGEFALGLLDSASFFELDFNYTGPLPALSLSGVVDGVDSVTLSWEPSPNATEYLIYRGDYVPGATFVGAIDSTSSPSYGDGGLTSGDQYLYVVLAKNPGLTPVWADEFSNAIVLEPQSALQVDTVIAAGSSVLAIEFTRPVSDDLDLQSLFELNGADIPTSMVRSADNLILGFEKDFNPGVNILTIDSSLRDVESVLIDPNETMQMFSYSPDTSGDLILESWYSLNNSEAVLVFNLPVDASAIDEANYRLHPYGRVTNVSTEGGDGDAVRVTIADAAFGSLGNPMSVIVTGVAATDGTPINEKEGNVATFTSFQENLDNVFVYPNPVLQNTVVDGLRFANLTRDAEITVLKSSGRFVISLTESDGDGGLTWDMTDEGGNRIKPGVYVYRVTSGDMEFIGKFAVVE